MHTNLLSENLKRERCLPRPRSSWEDNIKMDYRRLWCHFVYWIDWVQGSDVSCTLVTMILNLWVSLNVVNILTG
jgi:hypothetical protein